MKMKSQDVYRIKLMFEWGGGTIWCGNDLARSKFGVGPIEDALPISDPIRYRLSELTKWHDTALNWEYPPDPSPWSDEERTRFEAAANSMLIELQSKLGASFEVIYKPL
jgi:hypothetical protein